MDATRQPTRAASGQVAPEHRARTAPAVALFAGSRRVGGTAEGDAGNERDIRIADNHSGSPCA